MDDRDLVLSANTLNYLILQALASGADHGYSVARWVERVTDDALRLEEGSLYPALHRLERQGLLEASWGRSENNRRAKFYRLTVQGEQRLRDERASWLHLSEAMAKVVAIRE